MTVRVSVIVPCHDHGHLLGDALESIAVQGVEGVEVIVVDDRSTDETASVARAHSVRVIRSTAPGAGAARNAGVAAATGGILAFLDADDIWTPKSLESRLAALEDTDAAYGAVEEFIDPGYLGSRSVARTVGAVRVAGTTLVTRRAWDAVGPLQESLRLGEFIDWIARFDSAGLRASGIPDVVLRRRIHASNTTRGPGLLAESDYLAVARLDRHRRSQ
jgi:glycosyltransferase involved in cell wall biosynthesis